MPRHCDEDQTCFNCNDLLSKCSCGATETYSRSSGPVCPYCGSLNMACDSDGYLYSESLDEWYCNDCDKAFSVSVHVSYSWKSKKAGD
jgi:hypothetical protein